MKSLHKKAFGGLLGLLVILGVLLFGFAGTVNYWQAWIFLVVFGVSTLGVTLYLMKNDPKLLERRVRAGPGAEKEAKQKLIQFVAQIVFILIVIFPGLDHRFSWSGVSIGFIIIGDVLVAWGLYLVFLVFKANNFTSATIEVGSDQKVVSTGPYALIRHPMYSGALVMLVGMPIALGSWWGVLTVIPLMLVIVWRLLDEEKFLTKNLKGYKEYCQKVHFRLIPLVW
jgi:protein-S-isoprenylcysteine O-methyltransferase Ste14